MNKNVGLIIALLFFLSLAEVSRAQNQGNIWYFGQNAGLDFNSGSPEVLSDGALNTDEGCATICDARGNLLFYTDGLSVWNRLHEIMPNGQGLAGDSSSTQSAIIVPHPGNVNLYYIFTVDNNLGSGGLKYSVVDMRLGAGRGDVMPDSLNISLFSPSTEKITAVQHRNGIDVWLIAHAWNSDAFYVYRIGAEGLNREARIQNIGTPQAGVNRIAHGYMKASPDGSRLALAIGSLGICELFNFNDSTGVISNPRQITDYDYVYGLEFSPNSSLLYLSFRYTPEIHQFDIKAGGSNAIRNSRRVFNTIEPIGALQLAVDGKIYVSKVSGFLGVFNQPNNRGAAAQFQENAVLLDGRQATLGLPSFVQSFFKPTLFDFEGTCLGEVTKFFPRDSENIDPDLIEWDFGDPDSGPRNTSREMFPEHQFRKPGLYLVRLDITLRNGVSRSLTQKVYISGSLPVLDLGPDRRLCPNEELNFDVSIPGEATYIWNADTTLLSPIYSIGSPGKYWVEVSNDCGSVVDTIIVDYYDPGPPLPNNQVLCPGDTFRVDATMEGAINYLWNDGVKGAVRNFSRRGIYEVAITTEAGCEISKSIFIEELDSVLITTESSFQICRGSAKEFETNIDAETFPDQNITYLWSTGSTDPSIIVENPDTTSRPIQEFYWVVVSLDSCASFASQNITLLENEFPDPPIQPLYFHCENDSVLVDLSVDSSDYRYRWFSLQLVGPPLRWVEYFEGVGPTQYFNQGGLYVLYSFDGPCLSKDTFAVITQGLPDPYIYGPDFCPGDTAVTLIAYSGAFSLDDSGFIWDDGSTNQERIVTEPGSYSVSVTNNCGTTETEVSVGRNTIPPPEVNLGNDTTLCSGNILRLDARQSQDPDAYFYSWNDGSFDSSIEITQSGIYSIQIGNGCVTVQDEIKVTFTDTPMAQFNDEEYICNEDTVKLVATNPNATYEWKNSAGEVISRDSVYFATETGTYSVAITNDCFTAEYETLVLPFEDGVDIGENQLICQSGDDRVVLSVAVRDAIYTWQDGSNESTLIADTSGVYWVVVEREECISSDTVVIKYLSDLEVDLGEEQFLCEGDSIILRASNATEEAQYEWYKDGLLVSNDSTLLVKEPGNYGVKVENSCKIVEDQVSVSPIDFTNNLPSTLFACQGETRRLDATVAGDSVAYLWSNGSPEASILVDSSGIYSVRISKQNCEITQNVEFISLDLSFSIDLGSDTLLCAGEQLRLNATTPNGKYEWQDGSTDSIFVVNQAGTYWVEVSNDCGEARDSIVVAFKEFPQLDLGKDTTLCPGEVLNLDVNQAVPSTYLWSNGSTDAQISVSQSETLWVEVVSDGCIDRDTIQVNFIEPISFDLGPDLSICPEDVLTLRASLNRSDVQYVWQDGSTDTSIVVNQPGTYWLEIYNDCQRIRDSVEVSLLAFPRVDFGADLVLCPGDSLLLDASNPSSTYLWHDGSTAATYLVTRPEVVTVEVRNANGCVVKESILIDYRAPLAPVNLGNDTTLCAQTSLVLNASSLHPEARYRWQDGSTDSIFVVTSPGLYSVEVFNTCESYRDEIQVDYYDLPVVDLGEDILACPGEQITLDARNPSSTYLWSDGSTNATFTVTSSQTIWVEVMHANGCTARDTVEVIFKPNPEIDFGPDVEICDGDQLVLNALQPFSTYLWQDGSTEPSFTVTQAGTYSVVVDNGCTQARGEITVGVIPLPFVNLGIDTLICFNQTLLLEVPTQENVTYEWQDGSKESSFLVTETGEYWVEVNRQGCIVRDEINILYIECFEDLEIPNIITPNGDGKNEYFVIDNLDLRLWTLSIHDRHGSKVFETDNYQNNWDARDLPSDVYFYRLIKRGSDLEVKGWIKVMR